jgi:hypothetical protein
MEFELQKDKFDNPENSFWVCARQHYTLPHVTSDWTLVYWGRQFRVTAGGPNSQLIKDVETAAKEFGAASQLTFDK